MTSETIPKSRPDEDGWLIVKRDLYFCPDAQGYTGIRDKAGVYSEAEARAYAQPGTGVSMIRLSEAPEFTKACFDDLARAHLQRQRDELRAQVAELTKERDNAIAAVDAFADICDELGCDRDNEAGLMAALNLKESLASVTADRDRIERNRDMWKGQCERQAAELTKMRTSLEQIEEGMTHVRAPHRLSAAQALAHNTLTRFPALTPEVKP